MRIRSLAISLVFSLVGISLFSKDITTGGKAVSSGLTFKSYEVIQDDRTSLDLTREHPVNAGKGFSLEFDIRIRHGFSFGYIFRLIDNNLNHLDFCSNHNASKYSFHFGDNNRILSSADFEMEDESETTHHITVSMEPESGRFVCCVDSLAADVSVEGAALGKFSLLFGCVDNDRYFTTDIPRFTLSNVILKNERGETIAEWPMSRHSASGVRDIVSGREALVRNGVWEIDNHTKWTRRKVFNISSSEIGLAHNSDGNEVYIVDDTTLTVYFIREDKVDLRKSSGSLPKNAGVQLVYDGTDSILLTATENSPGAQFYNLTENRWCTEGEGTILPISNHQGMYFNDTSRVIYFIGGYGMHRYYNELHSFDFDGDRRWEISKIKMTPRYLCAVGEYDGKLLVAGGYGSRSGLQEEDPHNLYDILSVDPATGKCDTLSYMSGANNGSHFVFSSSMVADEAGDCFYSLIFDNEKFNSEVRLARVNVTTGKIECFADPLQFKFHDLYSYCQIFLGGESSKYLYAVLAQPQGDDGCEVSIYSMAYPPLHKSEIIEEQPLLSKTVLYLAPGAILISILFVWIVLRRSRGRNQTVSNPAVSSISISKSFIRLLGGFQVIDSKGDDITKEFSPILKGVLSYIILRSCKDGKGVSNAQIENAFWPNMEHSNALNNRRVNLSRLRSILMRVGDVRIDTREGFVDFVIGGDVYCDYLAFMDAIKASEVNDIVAIGSLGPLLPDLPYDCLAEFKSDLAICLSDFLFSETAGNDRKSRITKVRLADIVLLQDALDENAIAVKCRALYDLGQKGLSKSAYDSYASQYMSLLGSNPDFSYSDILNSKVQ